MIIILTLIWRYKLVCSDQQDHTFKLRILKSKANQTKTIVCKLSSSSAECDDGDNLTCSFHIYYIK